MDDKDWNANMKKIKRILSIFICMVLFMPAAQIQAKKSKSYWPKISENIGAGSALLMDVDTGTILYKNNIDKKFYPASITKILTTLIAIENCKMDEIVTFSQDAVYKTEGSGIWRDIGEKMTMEECLYAVMLESANECAYAVAEHVGGSLNRFVEMMNERAGKIGCTSSNFTNPHGLPDENHYVTARDMALIAREAYKNETFRLICGTKTYVIPPTNKHKEQTPMTNHHKMLYPKDTDAFLYDYCTGGKTGWTSAAGSTLVTYAEKDGMTLLTVILQGTSPNYWNETRALLEFGFENFNLCTVADYAGSEDSYVETENKYDTLNTNEPYAQIDPQSKIILPKTVSFNKTAAEISYKNLPENVLAQLKYTYGKYEVGTADIVRTNVKIDRNDFNKEGTGKQADSSGNRVLNENQKDAVDSSDETENKQAGETGKEEAASQTDSSGKKFFDFSNFNFSLNGIRDFFLNIGKKLEGMKDHISMNSIIILIGIVVAILLIVIFWTVFNNSYIIRQKIVNFKNRRKAKKQYVIIRDTRKSRGKGWKKRR